MKKIKFYVPVLAFALLLGACNSSDDDANPQDLDYLIFGHFYGECFGENCIEIFKLEADALYEDDNDVYLVISCNNFCLSVSGKRLNK